MLRNIEPAGELFPEDVPRRHLLVVDDEPNVLRMLGRILRAHYELTMRSDPIDALRLIERGARFDLILCDLSMPGLTGAAFYDRLSRFAPEQAARIVVMTGGAFTQEARRFLDEGRVGVIEKPFDPADLRRDVELWIRAASVANPRS